ncbi:MAG: hypothetical protein HY527_15610 [Betaproteobacteria bacterium]|nr:hypothetical protein [Betaproteobacteria bacterium]
MSHPQIAAFARLAEGGTPPTRKIEGQKTLLGRTMHSLAYDEIHDEIVAPQPYAQAILTFRGEANGQEPPLRKIQGPLTQMGFGSGDVPDQIAIDPVNNEIYVANGDKLLVFSRLANGNVPPIRVLKGPDAMRSVSKVAIDPLHNLLLMTGTPVGGGGGAIIIFPRTAEGNTRPLGIIQGPKTSMGGNSRIYVYPPRGMVIVAGQVEGPKLAGLEDAEGGAEMANDRGFVGAWSIYDRGDVPPRWMIGGPKGIMLQIRGVALDPKNKTVMISDKRLNAVATFSFPEIF